MKTWDEYQEDLAAVREVLRQRKEVCSARISDLLTSVAAFDLHVEADEDRRTRIRNAMQGGALSMDLACSHCKTELFVYDSYGFGGSKIGCPGCGWHTLDGEG